MHAAYMFTHIQEYYHFSVCLLIMNVINSDFEYAINAQMSEILIIILTLCKLIRKVTFRNEQLVRFRTENVKIFD